MKIVAVMFLVLASVMVSAQQEKSEDTSDRKSVNGFSGHLLVVEDPRAFIEEWKKPETPNIKTAKEVKRDKVIGAFVIFSGCKPDGAGVCNAEVDYVVLKPDGTVYAERKAQPLWNQQAPPAQNVQLSKAILALRMRSADQNGEYKVKAKVSDLNAGVTFELETSFRLR